MKTKPFLSLLIICLVLGGISYFVLKKDEPARQQREMGSMLLDDFPVNDVASIAMESPEGSVTLQKGPEQWVVENRDGYPADFAKITDLVKKMKDMKIGRSFMATPEVQKRLGLNHPGQEATAREHQGTHLLFAGSKGEPLLEIVIGQGSAEEPGSDLQYVLLPRDKKVYQVDKSFKFLGKSPADWIDQQPLDVKAADVYQVTAYNSDHQPIYTLRRPDKGSDPAFLELPQDQKSVQSKIDMVFDALSPLTIEDVASKPEASDGQAPYLEYQLYDGLVYKVWPRQVKSAKKGENSDQYLLAIQASSREPIPLPDSERVAEEDKPQKEDPSPVDSDKGKEDQVETSKTEDSQKTIPLPEQAQQLNAKLSPWTYTVSKWVFDSLVSDQQALIEKEEDGSQPAS